MKICLSHHADMHTQKIGELKACKERDENLAARIGEKTQKILDLCKSSPVVQRCPLPGSSSSS